MANNQAGAVKGAATRAKNERERPLSEQEQEFVLHYLGAANRNATEAVILAGYQVRDRMVARAKAGTIMARPRVIAEIEAQTEARNERLKVTADDVLRELLVLKVDAEISSQKSVQAMRIRLDTLKTIGDHVSVGAFRRMVGLSNPNGGPIETVDVMDLSGLSDEELEDIDRARAILDRRTGANAEVSDRRPDQGGEGTAPESA